MLKSINIIFAIACKMRYMLICIKIFFSITVIRAKISSEKVVPASDDPLDTHKMIRYEIKQIKVHGIT